MTAHGQRTRWLLPLLALGLSLSPARAGIWRSHTLDRLNARLHGRLVDHTHNHGADNRIWSEALHEKRDLYVYLPPGFDPHQCYPVILWLHPLILDEQFFASDFAELFDEAMACGRLPPAIVAAPDGSLSGRPSFLHPREGSSFFINSNAGNYEDYVVHDVWGFLVEHYPIRPEREAHVLFGVSMGGFGAFNLGIKYRERFHVVIGIVPPLNLRWVNCHCRYTSNFDPACWAWRTYFTGNEVVGRYALVFTIRSGQLIDPLFGRGPQVVAEVSRENPIEMLETYHVCPGELAMYIGYAGKDNFNIDAQVESFLYRARQLGLEVAVGYDPHGRHLPPAMRRLTPAALDWLAPLLRPYSPAPVCASRDR
jgi:S-formylglutathione hydrolase FrmB